MAASIAAFNVYCCVSDEINAAVAAEVLLLLAPLPPGDPVTAQVAKAAKPFAVFSTIEPILLIKSVNILPEPLPAGFGLNIFAVCAYAAATAAPTAPPPAATPAAAAAFAISVAEVSPLVAPAAKAAATAGPIAFAAVAATVFDATVKTVPAGAPVPFAWADVYAALTRLLIFQPETVVASPAAEFALAVAAVLPISAAVAPGDNEFTAAAAACFASFLIVAACCAFAAVVALAISVAAAAADTPGIAAANAFANTSLSENAAKAAGVVEDWGELAASAASEVPGIAATKAAAIDSNDAPRIPAAACAAAVAILSAVAPLRVAAA